MARTQAAPSLITQVIPDVRAFNRFYTRQIGLLDQQYLDSPYSLTEVRVLYELAHRQNPTASAIAGDLGLDLGYLSRMLQSFQRRRLVSRVRSTSDRRQWHLRLTPEGRRRFLPLDRAAHGQLERLLEPLSAEDCKALADSMRHIRTVLGDADIVPSPVRLRGLQPGDIGYVTHRQAVLYAQEYGWNMEYEALVAEILAGLVGSFDPKRERAWIAERDQQIVGSIFLVSDTPTVAKLRLLYVEPSARGSGLGRRLVQECITTARRKGYRKLSLWTNDVLVSARKIYVAAGFQLTREESHHSFGKDLVAQVWDLPL